MVLWANRQRRRASYRPADHPRERCGAPKRASSISSFNRHRTRSSINGLRGNGPRDRRVLIAHLEELVPETVQATKTAARTVSGTMQRASERLLSGRALVDSTIDQDQMAPDTPGKRTQISILHVPRGLGLCHARFPWMSGIYCVQIAIDARHSSSHLADATCSRVGRGWPGGMWGGFLAAIWRNSPADSVLQRRRVGLLYTCWIELFSGTRN